MSETSCVITFHSTYQVLRCEREALQENYRLKVIPVPRQLSSSCGLACRVEEEDYRGIVQLCREREIEFDRVFKVFSERGKKPQLLLKN